MDPGTEAGARLLIPLAAFFEIRHDNIDSVCDHHVGEGSGKVVQGGWIHREFFCIANVLDAVVVERIDQMSGLNSDLLVCSKRPR